MSENPLTLVSLEDKLIVIRAIGRMALEGKEVPDMRDLCTPESLEKLHEEEKALFNLTSRSEGPARG